MLIRRELDAMVYSWQEAIRVYTLVGIGYILVMWVLGPRVVGVIDAEQSSLLISILGFMIAGGRLTFNLEQYKTNRQQTFLETLPVRKGEVVHAKFISLFLLGTFTFAWTSFFIFINVFLNDGEMGYWVMAWLMSSMFVFITGVILLCYFLWGHRRIGLIFYSSLAVWTAALIAPVFMLKSTGLSFFQLMGLALLASIMIYFVCWWAAVRKVNRKGLPWEELSVDNLND